MILCWDRSTFPISLCKKAAKHSYSCSSFSHHSKGIISIFAYPSDTSVCFSLIYPSYWLLDLRQYLLFNSFWECLHRRCYTKYIHVMEFLQDLTPAWFPEGYSILSPLSRTYRDQTRSGIPLYPLFFWHAPDTGRFPHRGGIMNCLDLLGSQPLCTGRMVQNGTVNQYGSMFSHMTFS